MTCRKVSYTTSSHVGDLLSVPTTKPSPLTLRVLSGRERRATRGIATFRPLKNRPASTKPWSKFRRIREAHFLPFTVNVHGEPRLSGGSGQPSCFSLNCNNFPRFAPLLFYSTIASPRENLPKNFTHFHSRNLPSATRSCYNASVIKRPLLLTKVQAEQVQSICNKL